jgi:hypothetical protein
MSRIHRQPQYPLSLSQPVVSSTVNWQRFLTVEILKLLAPRCYYPANIPQLKSHSATNYFTSLNWTKMNSWQLNSKSHCDWRSVSRSVRLSTEPYLGFMTRYLLLFDSYDHVFVGRPLWREDGYGFCICCWPLPAQSSSGPSPFTVSDLRLHSSSPPTTRRVMVEVFDPASKRVPDNSAGGLVM